MELLRPVSHQLFFGQVVGSVVRCHRCQCGFQSDHGPSEVQAGQALDWIKANRNYVTSYVTPLTTSPHGPEFVAGSGSGFELNAAPVPVPRSQPPPPPLPLPTAHAPLAHPPSPHHLALALCCTRAAAIASASVCHPPRFCQPSPPLLSAVCHRLRFSLPSPPLLSAIAPGSVCHRLRFCLPSPPLPSAIASATANMATPTTRHLNRTRHAHNSPPCRGGSAPPPPPPLPPPLPPPPPPPAFSSAANSFPSAATAA